MLDLIIIGAGPRGLAVAVEAEKRNLNFVIIDPRPLKTWKELSWYSFQMRSPRSFDLVIEEDDPLSLKNFMDKTFPQEDSEFIYRDQFVAYLDQIVARYQANLKLESVTEVLEHQVTTDAGNVYQAEKIVLALGSTLKKPNYFLDKVTKPEVIVTTKDSQIVVVGSGQGAAEYVSYFAQHNKVIWLVKKGFRVYQYPIPNKQVWGFRCGFGSYFKAASITKKLDYINKVKAWQPAITPYVNHLLTRHKNNIQILNTKNLAEIQSIIRSSDYTLVAIGSEFDVNNYYFLPELKTLPHNPKLPCIYPGFKTSISSIRITGLGAIFYDGLRQGSVGSSGSTAIEILSTAN